jgi:hypothetical protein
MQRFLLSTAYRSPLTPARAPSCTSCACAAALQNCHRTWGSNQADAPPAHAAETPATPVADAAQRAARAPSPAAAPAVPPAKRKKKAAPKEDSSVRHESERIALCC